MQFYNNAESIKAELAREKLTREDHPLLAVLWHIAYTLARLADATEHQSALISSIRERL